MINKKIYIYGAKGSGLKVLEILLSCNKVNNQKSWMPIFIDDDLNLIGKKYFGIDVISLKSFRDQSAQTDFSMAISVGNPNVRKNIHNKLNLPDYFFPNLIHPMCNISEHAELGYGNILCQNVTIQPGCQLGSFNILNINAIMGPLASIENYNTINSHTMLASESKVGNNVYIGMGGMVQQKIVIGNGCVIGANTFIRKCIPNDMLVSDSPGKVHKKLLGKNS